MGDGFFDVGASGQYRMQCGEREQAFVAQWAGNAGHADAQTALVDPGDGPEGAGEMEMPVRVAVIGPGRFKNIHTEVLVADVVGFA